MSDKNRKYATANHPTVEALIHALYRYPTREKAIARFKHICKHFVLSKEQPESTPEDPVAVLWIKGFDVSEEEAAKGYTGHYAEMRVAPTDKGSFTLTATRVERPLASHPQKKRLRSKHPNWGHPVMRAVKKKKRYDTLEAANAELELLHTEFPEVSIPGQSKLFIIIYEKRADIKRPTHKIALELQTHTDGGYIINWRDNERPAKPKSKQAPGTETAAKAEEKASPSGYFTSLVALRKSRKKRGGRPETGQKPAEEKPEA